MHVAHVYGNAAETADWLRDHVSLFGQSTFLVTAAVLVLLALKSPPARRARLRFCVALLAGYQLFTLLRWPFPESTTFHAFLAGCGVLCLVTAVGATAIQVLAAFLDRTGRQLPRIAWDLLHLALYCVALVVVLYRAGVDPAALLTGSAVLTAVVGLAFRDTLGNFIAGVSFHVQPPFRVGDWIQFDQNPANIGRVTEINWRATRIVTNEEVELVLPNGPLAQAFIRNFTRPDPWAMRSVYVTAPFAAPPERVRRVILAAIRDVPGVCTAPPPTVMTNGFTASGVEYWVRVFTVDFRNRIKVESDVRDRVWYALAREGIPIPTATHAVTLTQPQVVEAAAARARRRENLAAVPIFAVLPGDAVDELAAAVREDLFAPGEAVIRQGDAGNCLYLIESGEVVVTARQGDGPEVEVARLAPGSVFGEMSLMTGEPRTATATAVGECRLLVVDKPAVEPILVAHPELAERISRVLVERQAALRSRLADGSAEPAAEQRRNVLRRIREFFTLSRSAP